MNVVSSCRRPFSPIGCVYRQPSHLPSRNAFKLMHRLHESHQIRAARSSLLTQLWISFSVVQRKPRTLDFNRCRAHPTTVPKPDPRSTLTVMYCTACTAHSAGPGPEEAGGEALLCMPGRDTGASHAHLPKV